MGSLDIKTKHNKALHADICSAALQNKIAGELDRYGEKNL